MSISNKNIRDVAEIAAQIMMGEKALHPNQQKLDVHEPEKDELTAKDFEMLRNKKKMKEETEEVTEAMQKSDVPAYLRKQQGEKPLTVADVKAPRKDSISAKENLAKARNEEVELDESGDVINKQRKDNMTKAMKHMGLNDRQIQYRHKKMDDAGKAAGVKSDIAASRLDQQAKKKVKEEVEQIEEADIEKTATGVKVYGSSYGNSQRARREQVKRPVDDAKGPKMKDLKAIESEKKKKMSEMVATYKEQGLKGLFESLKKEEVIVEEPTSAEFDAQLADAKERAAGTKKQAEVSKAAVQAVQNEETHTIVQVIDIDPINGVQHSEIDLEERTLTEPETKKKEEIVKSMKKGIAGFKERYGDRAKEVMYATATKQAKGE